MAGLLIIIVIIAFDQLVKFFIVSNLDLHQAASVIPGVLSLMRVHNYGISFSMLQEISRYVLAGVSIAIVVVIAVLLKSRIIREPVQRWALVCVIGGALSNAIDRLFAGYVVDMFRFDFVSFGIFNVADVFIVVGSIIFVVNWLICDHRASQSKRQSRRDSEGTFWEYGGEPPAQEEDGEDTFSLEDYLKECDDL